MRADKLQSRALRAEDFAEAIEAIQAQRLCVVLDCCHAGGMGVKGAENLSDRFSSTAVPASLFMSGQQGTGRAVLSSSQSHQPSYIGMIYGAIHEFQAFITWLTVWLEHLEWSHYADIVSVLAEIHRYQISVKSLQSVVNDNSVVAGLPTLTSVTPIENCLYDWLIDSKVGTAPHRVALLFWNGVQRPGLAKTCTAHELPQLSGKAQLGIAIFSHDHQVVIQNLLPVACIINSIEKETINTVVAQWQTASRPEINRIGTDLAYALQISNIGCFLGLFFALRQLLIELVEQLYPLFIKAIRWILISK